MSTITPDQSREARRELGISQADVATAVGINRAYLSDFESGNLTRLTKSQLRKLRTHYEEKISAAREAGEEIDIAFGDATPVVATLSVETVAQKRVALAVADDVSEEVAASVMATIAENDKSLVSVLNSIAEREDGIFGPGELTAETQDGMRTAFTLLSANYLLIRSIGGWPEIGLSASNMNLAENSVIQMLMLNAAQIFQKAGLTGAEQAQEVDGGEA